MFDYKDPGDRQGPRPEHLHISSAGPDDQQQHQVQRWGQQQEDEVLDVGCCDVGCSGNGYMPCNGYVPCQPAHLSPDLLAERMEGAMPCHDYRGN